MTCPWWRNIANRVAVMYQGRLVEEGTSLEVLGNPQHDYTQSLVEAALQLQRSEGLPYAATPVEPILKLRDVTQHYTLEANPLARLLGGRAEQGD